MAGCDVCSPRLDRARPDLFADRVELKRVVFLGMQAGVDVAAIGPPKLQSRATNRHARGMNRPSIAPFAATPFLFACLALAGCPTTNTAADSGPRADAPTASGDSAVMLDDSAVSAPDAFVRVDAHSASSCMPAGVYRATMWTADPGNSAGCEAPSTTDPVRIGALGQPLDADGTPISCPPSCAAGECTITNATAPSCTGGLHLGASCTGGLVADVTYTINGTNATFGFSLISETRRCVFTGVGERIGS